MSRIKTYAEFYQFYLSEHQNKTCRILHFTGTLLVFVLAVLAVYLGNNVLWIFVPIMGYGFAWVGHYFFEKNKPATFSYPLWSLVSDFRMFFDILIGKISFDGNKDKL
ncbi:Mpo1-like protein [Lutimonas sp.]|uniref:Mpo1-like protein n=1 Tax=Lutimonas sp. TaxID=1872403 RepID=UPI003D9B2C0A